MINLTHVAKKPYVKPVPELTFSQYYIIKFAVDGCGNSGHGLDVDFVNTIFTELRQGIYTNKNIKTIWKGSNDCFYGNLNPDVKGQIELDISFYETNQFLIFINNGGSKPIFKTIQVNQTNGLEEFLTCTISSQNQIPKK
jgi:hypothetical protein